MGIFLKSTNGEPDLVDPRQTVVGHVQGVAVADLTVLATRNLMLDRFAIREHILQDNHTNCYIVYDARLYDRETYSVALWVKPSEIVAAGGTDPKPGWGLQLTDDLFSQMRLRALEIFATTQQDIYKPS